MPSVNPAFESVGTGFAAYLAPPPEGVVRFTVGQPDFATPQAIVDSAKAALDQGLTAYTRSQGSVELCADVAEYLTRYDIQVDSQDVCISPGCKQAVLYAMLATLEPGDEVILFAPAWPSYDGMIRMLGAVPVHVPVRKDNYHPDFDELAAAITPKTKALLINSPNNPTGAVYSADEVQGLVDVAVEHDLWIYDDMIYSSLTYGGHNYTSPTIFEGGAERCLTIGGWSKGWAMTGWRLGWCAGPSEVMKAVKVAQTNAATHVPAFLMPAAQTALSLDSEIRVMEEAFAERRILIHGLLSELPGVVCPEPEGAFYALADVTGTGMTDIEFADGALAGANVQVIPGSLMKGGEGLVRFSYATSNENIIEGMKRLKTWLEGMEN